MGSNFKGWEKTLKFVCNKIKCLWGYWIEPNTISDFIAKVKPGLIQ